MGLPFLAVAARSMPSLTEGQESSLRLITEEIVRLESHLAALTAALRSKGGVGKRIEFLLQEVQRELNTTSAKAGDPRIVDLALAAKGEVERLREQVQNVE